MNRQMSFSEREYASKKLVMRKDAFLAGMEQVVPWKRLVERLEAHYPKGHRGRPPVRRERMRRLLVVQNRFDLSNEGIEDTVYEIQSIRHFVGVDLGAENAPDATTVLKFRRLLEEHHLVRAIFEEVNASLAANGLYMKLGTIADATIVGAPSSTRNERKQSGLDMHQTKKGNKWHFEMKAHIGVDAHPGLLHSVTATTANEADISKIEHLPTTRA